MEYYSELLSFCTLKWDSFKIESPVLLKLSCDGAFLGIDCRVEEISTITSFSGTNGYPILTSQVRHPSLRCRELVPDICKDRYQCFFIKIKH